YRASRRSLQLSFLFQALSLNGGGRAVHPISWDDAFNIFIEISSFKDVLDSAKLRNKAFFEKIGLM
ncbi:hypothetical protein GGQ85_004453, partial [Nitrobacter vulgaris]|uniref:hypothetical protein n=1 Tax=Nitrobacter vulgaris TaxID=29421 RepID=UPI0028552739